MRFKVFNPDKPGVNLVNVILKKGQTQKGDRAVMGCPYLGTDPVLMVKYLPRLSRNINYG